MGHRRRGHLARRHQRLLRSSEPQRLAGTLEAEAAASAVLAVGQEKPGQALVGSLQAVRRSELDGHGGRGASGKEARA